MIIFILVLLGLCLGSFVNALVWRLHGQLESTKGQPNKDLSIIKGRSMCPNCGHQLAGKDLVPVLSWIELRGKCRYCTNPIGWHYPAVEMLMAGLFVASYLWWPDTLDHMGITNLVVWMACLVGLVALFVYDARWLILPNRMVYPLIGIALGLIVANLTLFKAGTGYLTATGLSILIGGGLFYGLFLLSNGKWIGGGDVKLGALIGLLLASPAQTFLVLFLASLIGTCIILPGLLMKKLKASSHIPFGPFLIAALIIVKLFGPTIIEWYKDLLIVS